MIKLSNNSGKKINITKDLILPPNKSITGDIEITPRLQQLISMKLLSVTYLTQTKKSINQTEKVLTEKEIIMNNIKAGYVKPSIPLNNISKGNDIHETKTNSSRRKK